MASVTVSRFSIAFVLVAMLTLPGLAAASTGAAGAAPLSSGEATDPPPSFAPPIPIPLKAEMLVENPSAQLGTPMMFKGFAGGGVPPYNYSWDFGDGSPLGYEQVTNHSYSACCWRYPVLTVTDSLGATATSNEQVWSSGYPYVLQTAPSRTPILVGQYTTLYATVGGGRAPYNFTWSFGDGSPLAYTATVDHRYLSQGYFSPTVTVRDALGAVLNSNTNVAVFSNTPVIGSSVSPPAGTDPLFVEFSSFVSGGNPPYNITWYPDDGSPLLYGGNVSHVYGFGTFYPAVNVIDSLGASNWGYPGTIRAQTGAEVSSSFLHWPPSGAAPLTVDFQAEPTDMTSTFTAANPVTPIPDNVCPALTSVVMGVATPGTITDVNVEIISFTHNWDSDMHFYLDHPDGTSVSLISRRGGSGNNFVNSVLDDEAGASIASGAAPFSGSYRPETVLSAFDGKPMAGTWTLQMCDDEASDLGTLNANGWSMTISYTREGGGTPPYLFYWNFGDGSAPATGPDQTHTYYRGGGYSATLTVVDATGRSSFSSRYVEVRSTQLNAYGIADPPVVGAGQPTLFRTFASGGMPPYTYAWSFDDRSYGNGSSVSHAYSDYSGYRYAYFTVCDSIGECYQSSTYVYAELYPTTFSIAVDPPTATPLSILQFHGRAGGGGGNWSYTWNFGDGSPLTMGSDPLHGYSLPGTYFVMVQALSSEGYSYQRSLAVEIVEPAPAFSAGASTGSTQGGTPFYTNFNSNPSGGTPPYSFVWDFGDGTGSNAQNTYHVYYTPGTFLATVVVTDSAAQTATRAFSMRAYSGVGFRGSFSVEPTGGPAPLDVLLRGHASGGNPPYSYEWNFGDASPRLTPQNASHQYARPGDYSITLTIRDQDFQTVSYSETVTASQIPLRLSASADPLVGLVPLTVDFMSLASGGVPPYRYVWDFGDGSGVEWDANPTHVYWSDGDFNVRVTVFDSLGQNTNLQIYVHTDLTPFRVNAEVMPSSGDPPLNVSLHAADSGAVGPALFFWEAGDGSPAVGARDVIHEYLSNGWFAPIVRAVDGMGRTDAESATIAVWNGTFLCNVWLTPLSGNEPHLASLGANVSGGTPPYSYTWDFNDGSPLEYSLLASHTFRQGNYYPNLQVMDSLGSTVGCFARVQVNGAFAFEAAAFLSPPSGQAPFTLTYSTLPQGGAPPYSVNWNFGDGTPSVTQLSGVHDYVNPGSYTVKLTVSDSQGNFLTRWMYVEAYLAPLRISASADRQAGYAPHTVQFEASGSGGRGPLTGLWNFGDGTIANGFDVAHTYASGYYAARFTLRDADGRAVIRTLDIEVRSTGTGLSVQLSADPPSGLAPCDVQFTATVFGGTAPYQFAWDFGDGGLSTAQDPSHFYSSSGNFYPTVTVFDSAGQIGGNNGQVECRGLPFLMTWTADPPSGVGPRWVTFDSTVSGGTQPYTLWWTFGDGSPSDTTPDPVHYFAAPGNYYVRVYGYDADGNYAERGDWLYFPASAPQLTVTSRIDPASALVGQNLVFNASVAGGNPPYTYLWDFWDGDTSTAVNTTHSYASSNWYYPRLLVTDFDGNSTAVQYSVYIDLLQFYADISAFPASGDIPLQVDFDGIVSGGRPPYTFFWDLGNGLTSTVEDPSTTYQVIGTYTATFQATDSQGTVTGSSFNLEVFPAPVSSTASRNVSVGTIPMPVAFSSTASGGRGPYDYFWEFGDGTSSWGQSPTHIYTAAGNHTARVRVTDSNGWTSFSSVWVQANPPPTATASITPNPTRPGVLVSFIGSGGGGTPPLTYLWEFGDGANAGTNNATHAYAAPGIYTANLTVTDSQGMTAMRSTAVDIRAPPVAALTATPRPTTVGVPVQFNGSASGGVPGYSWSWSFGDNSTSNAQSVAHTFTQAGTYNVVLTVTDSFGGVDTEQVSILVNSPPVASANVAPSTTDVGRLVSFTGSGSSGTPGYTYYWDFGDASGTTVLNPTHAYSSTGLFTATLWVTDSLGVVASRSVQVQVNPAPGLVASGTPIPTDVGVPVAFTATPSDGTGGYSYAWQFGDSATSSAQNPGHAYSAPGVYQVNVTATDSVGGSASRSFPVTVNARPTAAATAAPNPVTVGVPVAMTCGGSLGTPGYTFGWVFGDGGASSTQQNPSHTYDAPGMYTATCAVTDSVGVQSNSSRIVTVNALPVATASSNVSVTTVGVPVQFTGIVSGGTPGNNLNWFFGDGNISSISNPVHTFGTAGVYLVNLTATDSLGVSSSMTITVTVNPAPSSGISATPNPTTVGVPVAFSVTPSGGTTPYSFAWTFGDGGTSTQQNPAHAYSAPGNHTANVTVTDSRGVARTKVVLVFANELPTTSASVNPSTTTVGAPVQFNLTGSGGTDPMTILWDFGDGSMSSLQNPTHSYTSPGAKTATVTVTDALGVQDSDSIAVTVNPTPMLSLSATPNPTAVGAPVRFGCAATGGTAPFTFEWQFGDGNSSSQNNASHAYARNGTFTAVCFFTDGESIRVSGSLTIEVGTLLTSGASVSMNETTVGVTVVFNGSSAGGVRPYTFAWSFGDGGSATTIDATHRYTTAGNYTFTLFVSDSLGRTASASGPIRVNGDLTLGAPVPSRTVANVGQSILFTAPVSGGTVPYSFAWDFADGGVSQQSAPTHAFSVAGTYRVSVTVTDAAGRSAASEVFVVGNDKPVAAASASMTVTDVGVPVKFNGSASRGTAPHTFLWDFGDGTTSTDPAPTHVFGSSGAVVVKFTVTDSTGDLASVELSFRVNPAPAITLGASSSTLKLGDSVTIAATVVGGTGIASMVWTGLPTGCATANSTSLVCKPTATGSFTVTGTVTDLVGVDASGTYAVTITPVDSAGDGSVLGSAGTALVGLIVLLLVALAVMGMMLMREKNRRKGPLPEMHEADDEEQRGDPADEGDAEPASSDEATHDDEPGSAIAEAESEIERDELDEEENVEKDERT